MPKARRRANGTNIPPTSMMGRFSRIDRWSVVQRNVKKDWMKKSRPPVARSWFTGGLVMIGEMIRMWTAIPRRTPSPTAATPAATSGHPYAVTRKYTAYMHTATRST